MQTDETVNIVDNFEPILLKKLIYSGEFFSKVMPILKSEYFNNIGNQEIFKIVSKYYTEYKTVPTLTELVTKVKDTPNAEIRKEIISSLQTINTTDEVPNIDFLCNSTITWIKDSIYLKALQIGSDGLMKKDDKLKLQAQQLMDLRAKVSIDSDLGLDFADLDTMIEYYSARNSGIKTQHQSLNDRIGAGFLPSTLSIILAASGIGKSLFMTDIISGLVKKNLNVLLVSLEMQDKEIMKRVHANTMTLPINQLMDLSKTQQQLKGVSNPLTKEQIQEKWRELNKNKIGEFYIKDYPSGSFSPLMLENLVHSYKIEKDIDFDIIFVDYLGIMKSDLVSPSAGLYSYVKSIAEELRATAKKLNVPIVSASQLNRCISPLSTIITDKGIKQAKDIKKGDKILTNSDTDTNKYNTVQDIINTSKQKTYKIVTKKGKTIIVSGNHKIPTDEGLKTVNIGLTCGDKVSVL